MLPRVQNTGYRMTNLLRIAVFTILLAAPATAQTGPSFDCAQAPGEVEQVICDDPGLAALDRELARLYAFALIGDDMTPERQRELIALQRGWIMGRDGCWQADGLIPCVTASYGQRILELKTYYAGATGENGRTSFGPINYLCDAGAPQLSVVFIDGPVTWAVVSWDDNALMLDGSATDPGNQYGPSVFGDPFEFRMSHDEATFTVPGQGVWTCIQNQG